MRRIRIDVSWIEEPGWIMEVVVADAWGCDLTPETQRSSAKGFA